MPAGTRYALGHGLVGPWQYQYVEHGRVPGGLVPRYTTLPVLPTPPYHPSRSARYYPAAALAAGLSTTKEILGVDNARCISGSVYLRIGVSQDWCISGLVYLRIGVQRSGVQRPGVQRPGVHGDRCSWRPVFMETGVHGALLLGAMRSGATVLCRGGIAPSTCGPVCTFWRHFAVLTVYWVQHQKQDHLFLVREGWDISKSWKFKVVISEPVLRTGSMPGLIELFR